MGRRVSTDTQEDSGQGEYDEALYSTLMQCLTLNETEPQQSTGKKAKSTPKKSVAPAPQQGKCPLILAGKSLKLEDFVELTYPLLDLEKEAEIAQSQNVLEQKQSRHVVAGCKKVVQDLKCSHVGGGLLNRTLITIVKKTTAGGEDAKIDARKIARNSIVGIRTNKEEIIGPAKIQGVVYRLTEESITVVLDEGVTAEWDRPLQLELLANEITYMRLKENLQKLLKAEKQGPQGGGQLHRISFGGAQPFFSQHRCGAWKPFNERLDASQIRAIGKAMAAEDIALIHGPPGTGKSTAVVELILQEHGKGIKILAASASNMAVDNLAERILKANPKIKLVRMGHPARMLPQVLDSCLEVVAAKTHAGKVLKDCRAQLSKAEARMEKLGHRDHAERKELGARLKEWRKDEKYWVQEANQEAIEEAHVICSTLTGAAGFMLAPYTFGLVVIDEAAQAMEVDCWAAMLKAPRAVLAGDHLQLPPTIVSKEAAAQGLGRTLFERLHDMYGESISEMLTVQYRMNDRIMTWSSEELYEGKVQAHESNANHLIQDLEGFKREAVADEDLVGPLLLIDTAGCEMAEEIDDDFDDSKRNVGEARVAMKHCQRLLDLGLKPCDIGIITPYSAQVACLKSMRPSELEALEVGTVDGFQGREKEAIVISMVRSNDIGNVGFLAEKRRMNVAVTRARRHCALVCDTETVSHDEFIERLVKYFERHGAYENALQLDEAD